MGRYVRIELPARGTLTLAEVEVQSEGINVARSGKAKQKSTANGGDAARAIDGNTERRVFGRRSNAHGRKRRPALVGTRLGTRDAHRVGHHLQSHRRHARPPTWRVSRSRCSTANTIRSLWREGIAAPSPKDDVRVGDADPAGAIRRAAMLALTYVRGKEAQTFRLLAPRVSDESRSRGGDSRLAAHSASRLAAGPGPAAAE